MEEARVQALRGTESEATSGPESGQDRRGAWSRRGFFGTLVGAGAAAATGLTGLAKADEGFAGGDEDLARLKGVSRRQQEAFLVRRRAAARHLRPLLRQRGNGDEGRYSDRWASFSKCLPHNDLGEVDRVSYLIYLAAVTGGDPFDLDAIPLAPEAERRLVNPQAAYGFEISGLDGQATRISPAPRAAGPLAAAELGEVYWQALTRDVPFREYDTHPLIQQAATDLSAFSEVVGPTDAGLVTPATIFRGEAVGDLFGPYLSQFLWHDVPYGIGTIVQRYHYPVPGSDFMTDYDEWLAIQRGANPVAGPALDSTARYIASGRHLSEYVHLDALFQAFFNAALIALTYGPDAIDPGNPYLVSANQEGFATFGNPNIFDFITRGGKLGLMGAWYQKWLVHRRLRPEVMAGRVENRLNGSKNYDLHPDILNSEAVDRLFMAQGNRLLPMAFPEGSPAHPSYPAGHACVSGACATLLKAVFNEQFVIPNPVQASADGLTLEPWQGDDLALGNEFDKLAANISLGRDTAGVHYRSDGIEGMFAGEQSAIGLLRDYSISFNENFDGFTLTRFNGEVIRIKDGEVMPAF